MFTHSTSLFFFFNDTATTEIYTLSLHDALPICKINLAADRIFQIWKETAEQQCSQLVFCDLSTPSKLRRQFSVYDDLKIRSEEHTSELQSQFHLVCRLLLEKKKNMNITITLL